MTGPLADSLVQLIDDRIIAAAVTTRRTGTVASRSTDGSPWAQVTIDPSNQASPVKVLAGVSALAGDRVVLERFGSDWVVVGSFTQRGVSKAVFSAVSGAGSTTSGTYADVPGPVSVTFVKTLDLTGIQADLTTSSRLTAGVDTIVRWGLNINGTDNDISQTTMNTTNVTFCGGGHVRVAGVPAGTYAATLRWKSVVGTGTINVNTTDLFGLVLTEVGP